MKVFHHRISSAVYTLVLISLAYAGLFSPDAAAAGARDFKAGQIVISNPWVRLTISSRPGAGFMLVENRGNTPDRIISARSSVASRIEIHSSTMNNGIMKMRPVKGVDIPAKSQVAFKSGGFHLMIFGLKSDVKAGDEIPMTVVFAKAGALKITAPVESLMKKKMKMSE